MDDWVYLFIFNCLVFYVKVKHEISIKLVHQYANNRFLKYFPMTTNRYKVHTPPLVIWKIGHLFEYIMWLFYFKRNTNILYTQKPLKSPYKCLEKNTPGIFYVILSKRMTIEVLKNEL